MDTSRLPARLLGAAAALLLLPAAAQAATLTPLKGCYVSVTQRTPGEPPAITREDVALGGSGFTAGALVDLSLDGKLDRTLQADAAGNLPPQQLASPYQARGQGTFTLTAAEHGNPLNTVSLPSRTTELELSLKPAKARPSKRILFKGSGFVAPQAVWAHYLYRGKVRKTVRLVRRIDNPCGTFSVKRRQIPVRRPRTGKWTLQVDQQPRYSGAPDSAFVRVTIELFRQPAR